MKSRVVHIRKLVREAGVESVIAFGGSTSILTLWACRTMDVRVIISERNDPARQKLPHLYESLRKRLYGKASVVTANTRGALESMSAYVSAEKLVYIPNPLGSFPEVPPTQEQRKKLVLAVGRLHPQKGYDLLLEAWSLIVQHDGSWNLAIAGHGVLESVLKEQAKDLGIASRVQWLGRVGDMDPHYKAASIYVLPSRHEGMPNALMEAMSYGLPSMVTDASPGPLDLVRNGEQALAVPAESVDALAEGLSRLIRAEGGLRARLGDSARQRVAGFRLEEVAAQWDQLIASTEKSQPQDSGS